MLHALQLQESCKSIESFTNVYLACGTYKVYRLKLNLRFIVIFIAICRAYMHPYLLNHLLNRNYFSAPHIHT